MTVWELFQGRKELEVDRMCLSVYPSSCQLCQSYIRAGMWAGMHRDFASTKFTSSTYSICNNHTLTHTVAFGRGECMNMHRESTDETQKAERSNLCEFYSCQTVSKKHKAKLFYLTRQEKNMYPPM